MAKGIFGVVFFFISSFAYAQLPDTTDQPNTPQAPSNKELGLEFQEDTTINTSLVREDTILVDTVVAKDSLESTQSEKKGDIKTTVNYSARDSIQMDLINSTATLYGEAHADYQDVVLDAAIIKIDYKNNLLYARGIEDTTGQLQNIPVFKQGEDKYVSEEIYYNFKTRKARVINVETEQGEGILQSDSVVKIDDNTVLAKGNFYSPCLLPEPNYYIRAKRMKLIRGDKVVVGRWLLYLGGVPTPFGFLFGLFPQPRENSNGIIFPTYGESRDRGFFLRNGGYFFTIGDRVATRAVGEIYSKGGYGLSIFTNYRKRYSFGGDFSIRYNRRQTGDARVDEVTNEDYWFSWNHSPESKRNTRFSASVQLGSSSYNQLNSFNTENFLSTQFRSSVKFSGSVPNTPFNFALNLNQTQNTETGIWDLDLPSGNVGMRRIFPFKPKNKPSKTWYHKLGVNYNVNFSNRVSNRPVPQLSVPGLSSSLLVPERLPLQDSILPISRSNIEPILDRSRISTTHTVNVSTSARVLKYINLAPSFNYSQFWHYKKLKYTYVDSLDQIDADTVQGFFTPYQFSTSLNANTRIYGMYNINGKRLERIRHVVNPNIGFSYTPDFSNPMWGLYENVQINDAGETARVTPFAASGFGVPSASESGVISYGLTNTLEAKIKQAQGEDDTATAESKKVSFLENLSINGNYNLISPQFKLSNFNLAARTTLLGIFNINSSAILDPYAYDDSTLQRVDRYAWFRGQGIGRISSTNLAISTSLNPNKLKGEKSNLDKLREDPTLSIAEQQELAWVLANPDLYVDWSIPWNLTLSYNATWLRPFKQAPEVVQALRLDGDVSFTEKWKVGFTSSYDFQLKQIGFTSLNIYRDMHCWEMRIQWIPFGQRQSYSIEINAKASILQDLKISRRRSWYDQSFNLNTN